MLNYFINEISSFSDFYKLTDGMKDSQRTLIFEEMINLLFIYHPIYSNFTREYYTYFTLTDTIKDFLEIDFQNNLHYIMTNDNKWCTVQYVFNTSNKRVVWENYDLYSEKRYYRHFFVTNADLKNVLPLDNIDKNCAVYISGLFFNMLKPEWFTFVKHKLSKQLHLCHPLIPSLQNIELINDITNSFGNDSNIKVIEHEFNTDFVFNHYWINRELNNKITLVAVETFSQLLQFMNNTSYQKLVNNFSHQYITVYDSFDYSDIYCSDGLLLLNNSKDISDRIKSIIHTKNEHINLSIILTYKCTDILIEGLKKLNIIPNLLIAYPHSSNDKGKLFNDEILVIEKRLVIKYPNGLNQKYSINKNSIYVNSEYYQSLNIKNSISNSNVKCVDENTTIAVDVTDMIEVNNNDIDKCMKFKKTNIMDYLETNTLSDHNDENDEILKDVNDEIDNKHNKCKIQKNKPLKYKTAWDKQYHELFEWTENNGTLPTSDPNMDLSINDNLIEYNLGEFIIKQLNKSKKNKLTQEQIKKLELIDGWKHLDAEQKINKLWLAKYNQLFEWVSINGEFPRNGSLDEIEISLYSFLHNQCMKTKNNEMSEEKMYKMGLINGWDKFCEKYKNKNDWMKCFNLLKNLVSVTQKYPQCVISMSYEEYELCKFIELNRINYKFKNIQLNKIKELESIPNWNWKFATNANNFGLSWDLNYRELKAWITKNNAIPLIKPDLTPEVAKLALFANIQKTNKLFDRLNANQIKKLEILPFWKWTMKGDVKEYSMDDLWEISYNKLQLYTLSFKDFPEIEYNNNDTIDASLFIEMQKKAYHLGLLNEDKIRKLEGFKFWNWGNINKDNYTIEKKSNKNVLKDSPKKKPTVVPLEVPKIVQTEDPHKLAEWNKKYEEVIIWYENYGCLPKRNMRDEYEKALFYFTDRQKKFERDGNLSEYKMKKMELLPGWSWIVQKVVVRDDWDITFTELSKWIRANNKLPTLNVDNEIEKKLFEFCSIQIENKLQNKLSTLQIQKLELLKHWTWIKTPVIENTTTKSWDLKYNQLSDWVNKNGKQPIFGSGDKLQDNLIAFIYNNKQMYNDKKLNGEQIKKLELLKNWSWTTINVKK